MQASTATFEEDSQCSFNVGNESGGCAYLASSATLDCSGNTLIESNTAQSGGSIAAEESTVVIAGYTTLRNNSATIYGGAIIVYDSTLSISGYVCTATT